MEETFHTVVVGGGQAGLAAGYYLSQKKGDFVILDANAHTGDVWRRRWDSLRLFTPSKFNGLPGLPFPKPDFYYPTKDEVADYLEEYVRQFKLPVRHSTKARSLARDDQGFRLSTGEGTLTAKNVIVATGAYQRPYTPSFARDLDPAVLQLHSSEYCNPHQLPVQNVLVVGAGNSGAEIGLELARAGKHVWLSGPDVGRIPADRLGRIFGGRFYWWLISRVLSIDTPIGRKMSLTAFQRGAPLIRASRKEIADAGIESTPRVTGIESGKPKVGDERVLPVEGVIWATGYRPDYRWIDLPVCDDQGSPRHHRGVVPDIPGFYFVGIPFQTALNSILLGGVGREAKYIVDQIA